MNVMTFFADKSEAQFTNYIFKLMHDCQTDSKYIFLYIIIKRNKASILFINEVTRPISMTLFLYDMGMCTSINSMNAQLKLSPRCSS